MRYFLLCGDLWGGAAGSPLRRVWCVFELLAWMDLGGAVTLALTARWAFAATGLLPLTYNNKTESKSC